MTVRILVGHVLDRLRELPAESVHCVVTSPPYYGLRDYGIEPQVWGSEVGCVHEWRTEAVPTETGGGNWAQGTNGRGELRAGGVDLKREPVRAVSERGFCLRCGAWRGSLGLEPTLALYLDHMVEVFREVRRVMRKDATCWLNIGDSYCASPAGNRRQTDFAAVKGGQYRMDNYRAQPRDFGNLKPKDLMMIPARLTIRLQDDGWWVRSDIAWCKRAPMPESCADRPTSAWEHVFLLTKSARYYYDAEAVREDSIDPEGVSRGGSLSRFGPEEQLIAGNAHRGNAEYTSSGKRNQRNVWLLGPEPFPEAHFATFPTEIPRRAILAGSKPGGTILDPFLGSGTTALVADRLGRDCIGIELNPEYAAMARRRIGADAPLFAEVAD